DDTVHRLPSGDKTYVFHSGNIVGRELTDQSGSEQALPIVWDGQLKAGQQLLVPVLVATPTSAGNSAAAPLLTAFSTAIEKDQSLGADGKATLRHMGMTA